MQNEESFFGKKPLKIAHGLNFAPKIIPGSEYGLEILIWVMIIKTKKDTYANFVYDNSNVEKMSSYKYLGIDIHHKLNWNYRIEKRINGGWKAGIILGAKFSPWVIFRGFSPKKYSPFFIFWSPVSPNFYGANFLHPKNHQIII